MPIIPTTTNLTRSSVDILNAIRNNSTAYYRDYVPVANNSSDSLREIGNVIMNYPALQNEFLSALVNRIGRVLITSKMYKNPWAVFKKGEMLYGETIEEIFVNIAKPFEFDPAVAEQKVYKREIPDVRSAFHILNYQKFYKATISTDQLRQAFLSWQGVTDLIGRIVETMYTSANYDEFLTMKYILARNILNGNLKAVQVSQVTTETIKQAVSIIKGVSNSFEFMSNKYNLAGVSNYSLKDNQYLIVNSEFDAAMDVEVLASAFNMSKAEFLGHRVLIDGFDQLDNERLGLLFAGDPNYTSITAEELVELKKVPAVIIDRGFFVIIDNLTTFTENYNGEGLYWNYFYHVWKTFSISPFSNSAVFVEGEPSITSVTVSPSTVTTMAGQTVHLTAAVEAANFVSKSVIWTHNGGDGVTVDIYGNVTISADYEGSEIMVTATSVFDSTKSDSCVITIE